MSKILVQTTIPAAPDDWHVGRFSLLSGYLSSLGHDVTARDRVSMDADDPVLSRLDTSDFDQLWLFAVDAGGGVAESTFHHFCDYNWDTSAGCPSFVAEKPGDQIAREGPRALDDIKAYCANIARWLSPA